MDLYGDLRLPARPPPRPEQPSPADAAAPGTEARGPSATSGNNGGGRGSKGPLLLDALLGRWYDSKGHNVQVSWAKPGARGQLDVELWKSKTQNYWSPIKLSVKDLGDGHFNCGHFDMDVEKSTSSRIVWMDHRYAGQTSVWERERGQASAWERER